MFASGHAPAGKIAGDLYRLGLNRNLMRALELKIPPPVVALLVAAAMWGISLTTPSVEAPALARVVAAIAIALAGVGFAIAGSLAFRRAKTTVNPLKPETTTRCRSRCPRCLRSSGVPSGATR